MEDGESREEQLEKLRTKCQDVAFIRAKLLKAYREPPTVPPDAPLAVRQALEEWERMRLAHLQSIVERHGLDLSAPGPTLALPESPAVSGQAAPGPAEAKEAALAKLKEARRLERPARHAEREARRAALRQRIEELKLQCCKLASNAAEGAAAADLKPKEEAQAPRRPLDTMSYRTATSRSSTRSPSPPGAASTDRSWEEDIAGARAGQDSEDSWATPPSAASSTGMPPPGPARARHDGLICRSTSLCFPSGPHDTDTPNDAPSLRPPPKAPVPRPHRSLPGPPPPSRTKAKAPSPAPPPCKARPKARPEPGGGTSVGEGPTSPTSSEAAPARDRSARLVNLHWRASLAPKETEVSATADPYLSGWVAAYMPKWQNDRVEGYQERVHRYERAAGLSDAARAAGAERGRCNEGRSRRHTVFSGEVPVGELPPRQLEEFFQARAASFDIGLRSGPAIVSRLITDAKHRQILDILVKKEAILLQAGVHFVVEELVKALRRCDYSRITPAMLEDLKKVASAHMEERSSQNIVSFVEQHGVDALQHLEHPHLHRLLYGVAKMPAVTARLDCMYLESTFPEHAEHCRANLEVLHSAVTCLQERLRALQSFFISALQLGNALNRGSNAPFAGHGFKLSSLQRFLELRPPAQKEVTFFHFVLLTLSQDEVGSLSDPRAIDALQRARTARTHTVYQDLLQQLDGYKAIKQFAETGSYKGQEIPDDSEDEEPDSAAQPGEPSQRGFRSRMRRFMERNLETASHLCSFGAATFRAYRALGVYLDDLRSVYPPPREDSEECKDVFGVLHQLFVNVSRARTEIMEQGLCRDIEAAFTLRLPFSTVADAPLVSPRERFRTPPGRRGRSPPASPSSPIYAAGAVAVSLAVAPEMPAAAAMSKAAPAAPVPAVASTSAASTAKVPRIPARSSAALLPVPARGPAAAPLAPGPTPVTEPKDVAAPAPAPPVPAAVSQQPSSPGLGYRALPERGGATPPPGHDPITPQARVQPAVPVASAPAPGPVSRAALPARPSAPLSTSLPDPPTTPTVPPPRRMVAKARAPTFSDAPTFMEVPARRPAERPQRHAPAAILEVGGWVLGAPPLCPSHSPSPSSSRGSSPTGASAAVGLGLAPMSSPPAEPRSARKSLTRIVNRKETESLRRLAGEDAVAEANAVCTASLLRTSVASSASSDRSRSPSCEAGSHTSGDEPNGTLTDLRAELSREMRRRRSRSNAGTPCNSAPCSPLPPPMADSSSSSGSAAATLSSFGMQAQAPGTPKLVKQWKLTPVKEQGETPYRMAARRGAPTPSRASS